MDFYLLDVFSDAAYAGNPLAVLPDASSLTSKQMQAIAREMNLSETSFVTATAPDSYDVRIFTPGQELPFAGHPTVGTAWLLVHLGLVDGDEVVQRSPVGATTVRARSEEMWFERSGASQPDREDHDPTFVRRLAKVLGLEERDVGLEARELGRSGHLRPAISNAGLDQLMVPVRDAAVLSRCRPDASLDEIDADGVYCFTALQAGRIQARGFFPGVGVPEDPATGSAAAALGLYLAGRLGDYRFELRQGVEMGRPSLIKVDARPATVEIGGRSVLVGRGSLEALP